MSFSRLYLSRKFLLAILLILLGVLVVSCQSFSRLMGINYLSAQTADIRIRHVVSSSGLDADSCPIDRASSFAPSDSIYIVAEASDVPAGTDIFARLSYEEEPVEDSVLITADQDYFDTCIYFVFEATSGAEVLNRGQYSAQLIVNGNPGPSVDFEVQ